MPRQQTTSTSQRDRELSEARRLADNLGDNFVRLVMIVPVSPEQRLRTYFVDSVGVIRCVTIGLTRLEKPSYFKSQVRTQLGYFARHFSEFIPRNKVTPAWRAEIAQALAEGRRFMANHPSEYRFFKPRDKQDVTDANEGQPNFG